MGPLDGYETDISAIASTRFYFVCCCRRYASKVSALRQTFSEYGLIRFRILVECRWLQQLAGIPEVTEVPAFSQEANSILDQLATGFGVQDAAAVKKVRVLSAAYLLLYTRMCTAWQT